jgi:hypothetical protein
MYTTPDPWNIGTYEECSGSMPLGRFVKKIFGNFFFNYFTTKCQKFADF